MFSRRCALTLGLNALLWWALAAGAYAADGSGSGGTASGNGGAAAPSQQPAAPTPAAGPAPTPEQTKPAPSYGPLAGYFQWKKDLENATGTIPRLNIDLTTQSVLTGPDEFTSWVWRYDFGILQKLWPGAGGPGHPRRQGTRRRGVAGQHDEHQSVWRDGQ